MGIPGWMEGVAAVAALGLGAKALSWFLPGLIAKKIDAAFETLRASAWLRDPAKPKRVKAYLALLDLLEEELPDPGQDRGVYQAAGAWIASLVPILAGSGPRWAQVLGKIGDAIDLEAEEEIKKLGEAQDMPPK